MKTLNIRLLGSLVTLSVVSAAMARPDLNSFINKPAPSTDKLIAQIKTDPEVADRYIRHFAMSKAEVVQYVAALHVDKTQKDDIFTIYSVPVGGHLMAHTAVLKRGTPVFADVLGKPTLIVKCGNPLTRGPRNPESLNENEADVVEEERITLRDTVQDALANTSDVVAMYDVAEPGTPILTDSPAPPVIGGNPTTIINTPGIGGGGLNLGPLGFGIMLVGAGLGAASGGHNPPVPEPAAILALGIGVGAVLIRRKG